jgi:hypothetical protein
MEIEPGHLELSGVPVATYFRTHKRSASLCSKQIVLSELNNKAGPAEGFARAPDTGERHGTNAGRAPLG